MWKIKDVKKDAKRTLKGNIWTLMLIGIFMSIVIGEYTITNDGFSNFQIVEHIIEDVREGKEIKLLDKENTEVILNDYFDEAVSKLFTGNMDGLIKSYNEKNNISKGVFFTAFNVLTTKYSQLQNLVKSIYEFENKQEIASIFMILYAFIGFMIHVLVVGPILVGESRVYLESKNYKKTKLRRIVYAFNKKYYKSSVKSILLMHIYKFLWNLTIIGGIIKSYSYKMVTFIVAENPTIKPKDAIKMSREMMNGNKFNAFKMDLSFVFWFILQYATFGLAGIYVTPYYKTCFTELYIRLRKEYIDNKKYNYEALNDIKLYEENDLDKYPTPEKNKKFKYNMDYNKNYELTSIILFFFIFSFVGWLWEVCLYLFQEGIFVNRGTFYGPYLPIYGFGCTFIILLNKIPKLRKLFKNPFLTFNVVMVICAVVEYLTSVFLEVVEGARYWDYTGIFLNINGRICLEGTLFFGVGGCLCLYIIAPVIEKGLQHLTKRVKYALCIILCLIFGTDFTYSQFYPHVGENISTEVQTNSGDTIIIYDTMKFLKEKED